jgi:hypothetical protein
MDYRYHPWAIADSLSFWCQFVSAFMVSFFCPYARALREGGGKVKIMMFPEDIHEVNL